MIKINDKEILTVLDGIEWGGGKGESGRYLKFQFIYNPRKTDDFEKIEAKCGYKVTWQEDEKNLFQGFIEMMEYDTDNDIITVSCRDCIAYLKRSKAIKNRFRGTLKEIAEKICGVFKLKNEINSDSKEIFNFPGDGSLSYYDILHQACQKVYRNFYLYIEDNTLKVEALKNGDEPKIEADLNIGENIRKSKFRQDIEHLVTRIAVIDIEGNLTFVEDNELCQEYGVFQDVYNYCTDYKEKLPTAEELKEKVNNTSTVVADNFNNCTTGRYVSVYEPNNKITGTFEIVKDKHTIGYDSFMELELKEYKKTT